MVVMPTTYIQPTSFLSTTTAPLDELPTEELEAERPRGIDALASIDYRTRRLGVSPELAPPGRYLAFEGRDETLLVSLQSTKWPTHLGRGFAADICLEDQAVSRRHAIISAEDGLTRLLDDRSANGTFVNGQRVIAAELRDGDVIVLGWTRMRYVEVRGYGAASRGRWWVGSRAMSAA
jgi:hypothetical protein